MSTTAHVPQYGTYAVMRFDIYDSLDGDWEIVDTYHSLGYAQFVADKMANDEPKVSFRVVDMEAW